MSSSRLFPILLSLLLPASACQRTAPDEAAPDHEIVVQGGDSDGADPASDSGRVSGAVGHRGGPGPLDASEFPDADGTTKGPDLGSPLPDPPGDMGGSDQVGQPTPEAVGWVSVSTSDRRAHTVLQNFEPRGVAAVRLTQRPGEAIYVVRDARGTVLCLDRIQVRQYESVCLECDVRTGEFVRTGC